MRSLGFRKALNPNPKLKETTGGEFRVYRASIRLPQDIIDLL